MLSFVMRILGRDVVKAFMERHPNSQSSLKSWAQAIEANHFKHLSELRQTFGSADYVRPYTIFDISGNKYRLIALVNYQMGMILVQQILTHSEYDRGKWRK